MDQSLPTRTTPSALSLTAGLTQVPVPATPVIPGPDGIVFDFNEGCRVAIPPGATWRVRLTDLDTDNVLFEESFGGGLVTSAKKYYVRFRIEIWRDGAECFTHDFDAAGRNVLARMEVGGLGDQIAWLGHAIAFARTHRCHLTCAMTKALIPLFEPVYPEVKFQTADQIDAADYYATYKLFIFYNDDHNLWQPCDYRQVGLARTAAYILGTAPTDVKPLMLETPGGPPIAEPYVCIAVQATSQNKYWNNPHGWLEIAAFLKTAGFRVICIDQKPTHGAGAVWNHIPHGAEDETGDRPLAERLRWLRHAAFFVGLSSGLSWLAWAAGCPVVMISGFTHPINEFHTPYRVINYHACNSCSNDVRLRLDPTDFLWCPRLSETPRIFECTRLITAAQVKAAIRNIPAFAARDI